MNITTITSSKTQNFPAAKQNKIRQFFRKHAASMRLAALGAIALFAISNPSSAQTPQNKATVDSTRQIITKIDARGYLTVGASWDSQAGGGLYVANKLAGMSDSPITSEKDAIKKIEILGRINADSTWSSDAVTFYIFPRGALEVRANPYTGWPRITTTIVSNDTIFRSSIFVDRDTTGQPVAFAATATTTFVFLKKDSYAHFFPGQPPFGEPLANPKFHSDKLYVYETDEKLGGNMYRFSKTTSEGADVNYCVKVRQ